MRRPDTMLPGTTGAVGGTGGARSCDSPAVAGETRASWGAKAPPHSGSCCSVRPFPGSLSVAGFPPPPCPTIYHGCLILAHPWRVSCINSSSWDRTVSGSLSPLRNTDNIVSRVMELEQCHEVLAPMHLSCIFLLGAQISISSPSFHQAGVHDLSRNRLGLLQFVFL